MDSSGLPLLAPGLRVVRRGRDHLQVGLYDGRRALLPRTPVVERALAALLDRRPVEEVPEARAALEVLERRGCLTREPERDLRVRRRTALVSLSGEAPGAHDLLVRTGVRVVDPGRDADVALVVSHGELDRDRLDPLIRRGRPHLVVRLVDGVAVLGPFVVPGVTACLRCIDAHESIHDPDHVPVTTRYVRATATTRADGVPDVRDPLLPAVAVTWACRDVVAHLGGRRPATWSRTLLLDVDPCVRREQDWSRHPECGCCWAAHDPLSGTMGA